MGCFRLALLEKKLFEVTALAIDYTSGYRLFLYTDLFFAYEILFQIKDF